MDQERLYKYMIKWLTKGSKYTTLRVSAIIYFENHIKVKWDMGPESGIVTFYIDNNRFVVKDEEKLEREFIEEIFKKTVDFQNNE
jgi:hypothetical protein